MASRIPVTRSLRSLAFRPRAEGISPAFTRIVPRRNITADEKPLPKKQGDGPGPNQEQLPHVSEEAAAVHDITGEGSSPDISQGTPVEEVLARDDEAKKKAPQVLKDKIAGVSSPKGSRPYSTSARRSQEQQQQQQLVTLGGNGGMLGLEEVTGHKFGLPEAPLGRHDHKDYRFHPVVKQLTGLMMRDGKLARAQWNMSRVLNHLRTSAPPKINPLRPLVPGAPPPSHLPLDPVLYVQLALDSVAPLVRLRNVHGLVGGGMAAQVPSPMHVRQRRRMAFTWILEAAEKKHSRSSGRGMFAQKLADEIIAVVEGKSGAWEKRTALHKLGTAARSNVGKKAHKHK